MRRTWKILQYVIAREKHEDGNYHLHAFIKLDKKVNIGDPTIFDVEGFHPNIQGARSNADVIKYVTKDGDWISNLTQQEIEQIRNSRANKTAIIG